MKNVKAHQHRLKGEERICKAYQSSPMDVLEMVDKEHLLFHIKSETNSTLGYSVSLKTYYCNWPDRVFTCKHIFRVQSIFKEFFEKPKDDEFVEIVLHMESNMETIDVISPSQVDEPMEDATPNDAIWKKMLNALNELDSLCKVFLIVDNEDEMKWKLQALQACIATCLESSSFERSKTLISPSEVPFLPYKSVKRTRMGHGRKRPTSEIGEGSILRSPLKRPPHMLVSHSKQKWFIFRKLPKVSFDVCATRHW